VMEGTGENALRAAVRRTDWRLTVRPMAVTERSDLLAAGGKQVSACLSRLLDGVRCGAVRLLSAAG
jgi:hypothetical protein